jgi:hypothetical protein
MEMKNSEKFFDSKTIADLIFVLAVVLAALFYIQYAAEIEEEVTTVIVNALNDVNSSLAEQEAVRN